MRRTAIIAALVAIGTLTACSEPAEPPSTAHVGLWESVWRGPGGAANSFQLDADSIVTRYYMKAFDFTYEISGDSLHMEPIVPDSLKPDPDSVIRLAVQWAIEGDTLIRTQHIGKHLGGG